MDSQTNTVSVPSSMSDTKKRKIVLVAFIILAVIVVGWLLIKNFSSSDSSVYEERAVVIDQIAAESTQYGETTNVIKGSTLDQIQMESMIPARKKGAPETGPTPEEKQAVIDTLISSSTQ